ncbi:MAG: exopolyphosphatase [Bacteroidota bacterium]
MLFCCIDIGSNAGRFLVTNVFENNQRVILEKLSLVRVPLRLGLDSFNDGIISPEKTANLINSMLAFRYLIEVYKPASFRAVATSALREAYNANDVIRKVKTETGFNLEIIDGKNEAELICSYQKLNPNVLTSTQIYIDVGGGSTEISIVHQGNPVESISFRIGTLRILNEAEIEREWFLLHNFLLELRKKYDQMECIGSGGNINKLCKLYGVKNSRVLSRRSLSQGLQELSSYNLQERIEILGLRHDRADVIIPAAKIFLFVLKILRVKQIGVPRVGLADGVIHMLYLDYKNKHNSVLLSENSTH